MLPDLGFVAALLFAAAVPLVVLRGNPLLDRADCLAFLFVLLAGLVAWWAFSSRRSPREADAPETPFADSPAWWQTAGFAGLLAVLVGVTFVLPLRLQFWGGTDDFSMLPEKSLLPLMADWDGVLNRPLTVLPGFMGHLLTPDRIEGYLVLAAGLCWLNALLLHGLLRTLLPGTRLLPGAAAVLFALDRSEPSRFFVLWTANYYWLTLAFLMGGLWLFLRSYRSGSRVLLCLSCVLLTGALLTNESSFPLAVIGPLLAWSLRDHRARLPLWSCAWFGTVGLLATRLLLFLADRGANAYQASQTASAFQNPLMLWRSLQTHLLAGLTNFQTSGEMALHWKSSLLILTLVVILVLLAAWRSEAAAGSPRRLPSLGVAAGAILAVLLGSVPFLHVRDTFRTQFLAAPGQALLFACALCGTARLLGQRAGVAVVAVVLGLLAANGTAETRANQQQQRAHSPINFERTVHIVRQIRAAYAHPMPDCLILLYLDEPTFALFACNYCCLHLTRHLLGTPMIQANFADPNGVVPAFGPESVRVENGERFRCAGEKTYDKVLAFRLALDGTVTLLRRLPVGPLPPVHAADRYDPLALCRPVPVTEVPYLRMPFWAAPPTELFDFTDGVLLGEGWGALQMWEGKPSRRCAPGAELFINPLGLRQRRLCFRPASTSFGRLEALDPENNVVATADLSGGGEVVLTVPTDPARLNLIRLRVIGDAGLVDSCRFFCTGSRPADFQRPSPLSRDIVSGGLALGEHWHLLETHNGQTFRWVDNDAELVLRQPPPTPKCLLLDVEAGVGMGGEPCRLAIQDHTGKGVAEATVRGRETLRIALPDVTAAGTVLRLHVAGGGRRVTSDPRVLNFRVFRCAWEGE